jgi:hypothetical protein
MKTEALTDAEAFAGRMVAFIDEEAHVAVTARKRFVMTVTKQLIAFSGTAEGYPPSATHLIPFAQVRADATHLTPAEGNHP